MEDFSQLFNNESLSSFYHNRPEYNEEIVKEMINFWRLSNKDRETKNALTIIDVGCGTGQLTKELMPYAKSIIGIDSSESQINEAKNLGLENDILNFALGSCYSLPSENNSVDMITAAQCVHWFDLDKFYTEVDRCLRTGGVLVMSIYKKGRFITEEFLPTIDEINKLIVHDIWFDENYFGTFMNERLKLAASGLANIPFLYPSTGLRNDELNINMNITLRRYGKQLQSSSVYLRWKRAHPTSVDMVDTILKKILFLMGKPETELDTKVVFQLPLSLILCSKV